METVLMMGEEVTFLLPVPKAFLVWEAKAFWMGEECGRTEEKRE